MITAWCSGSVYFSIQPYSTCVCLCVCMSVQIGEEVMQVQLGAWWLGWWPRAVHMSAWFEPLRSCRHVLQSFLKVNNFGPSKHSELYNLASLTFCHHDNSTLGHTEPHTFSHLCLKMQDWQEPLDGEYLPLKQIQRLKAPRQMGSMASHSSRAADKKLQEVELDL